MAYTGADVAPNDQATAEQFNWLKNKRPEVIWKAATETVNNSAVLQNDDDLLLTMAANEVWLVELMLLLESASATPDFKFGWTYPVACTMYWGYSGGEPAGARPTWSGIGAVLVLRIQTDEMIALAVAGVIGLRITAIVTNGANAGTLQLQWAQNGATAENSSILINSCLIAHLLS